MAMLTWLLWPFRDTWELSEEALVAFLIALVFWAFTEFKLSEEVIYRASTPNDIRFGREMFAYGTWNFRELLRDHDYHRGIYPRFLTEASMLISETELGIAHFQDMNVQQKYSDFFDRLKAFVDYFGMHSSPERFGSATLQSIIPANAFDEMNIADHHKVEISEVNRLATEAWKAMLPLIAEIKVRIPEVFDEPITGGWIRSSDA